MVLVPVYTAEKTDTGALRPTVVAAHLSVFNGVSSVNFSMVCRRSTARISSHTPPTDFDALSLNDVESPKGVFFCRLEKLKLTYSQPLTSLKNARFAKIGRFFQLKIT